MKHRIDSARWAIAVLFIVPGICLAQTSTVEFTFQVPLNLVNLGSDFAEVAVQCTLSRYQDHYLGETAIPVTGGQVVTTVNVVVSVPSSAVPNTLTGQSANYSCVLKARSKSGQWTTYNGVATQRSLGLVLAPDPSPISGTITL